MRTIIDLNGTWDFVADLDPKYHATHGGFQKPDANRRHWLKVPVPGVWQTYAERYDIFEGVCWFAREFEVPECAEPATARLRFGGVNYLARVYVNGELVGEHEGGYTEFVLDVTGTLRAGSNHIAVMVDNRATSIKWPPCLGYFNYGGIHRSVHLEIADGPWLDDVRIEAVPDDLGGLLTVTASVREAEPGLKVCVKGDGFAWEELVGEDGNVLCQVPQMGAELWSPDRPTLYPVRVELLGPNGEVLDVWAGHCGFRGVSIRDGRVHLNGEPLPLQGICYVYDSPVTGLVMASEQVETDLRLMKEAGCNAVRCHYPMDRVFYEACDRLGLLVWIEPPVYCYHPGDDDACTGFADPGWRDLALQMAREMVAVARNHPCVAIYGIGNECNTQNPEAEGFFRALAETVRSEDPTRLLSYAALYGNVGPLGEIVDVLGINSYWGWYDKIWGGKGLSPEQIGAGDRAEPRLEPIDLQRMRDMLDTVLERNSGLVLLLTEFGADSVPGAYSASRDLWSEDYHADLLRAVLDLAAEYPQIAGTFPFCFSDYRDPSKVPNGYWNELNLKGIVDYHRNRKLAWHALRNVYGAAATGTPAASAASDRDSHQ